MSPESMRTHRELQSVDPDALSDDELVQYLTRCRDRHSEMVYQHMRFTGAALLLTGDLLAHAGDGPTCRLPSCSGCFGVCARFRGRVDGTGALIAAIRGFGRA